MIYLNFCQDFLHSSLNPNLFFPSMLLILCLKFEPSQCCIQQFFGGAGFLTSVARRKTVVQLGSLGGGGVLEAPPSGFLGQSSRKLWLFCILNSSKHHSCGSATTNGDESLNQKSTLLRVWGSCLESQTKSVGTASRQTFSAIHKNKPSTFSRILSTFSSFLSLEELSSNAFDGCLDWSFVKLDFKTSF